MQPDPAGEITRLLHAAKAGNSAALEQLFSLVYDELRQMAKNRIGGSNWATEPTTLVHEAYLRLFKSEQVTWQDRHHFFWAAARAMRDILVDRVRRAQALKHGGGKKQLQLSDEMTATDEPPDLIDLNDALMKLEAEHPLCAKIISLRFFTGLSREQIAEILELSPSAVWREWAFARAWLMAALE
jgi:RNA polymerase sigma-70 factor, ECF subfamily